MKIQLQPRFSSIHRHSRRHPIRKCGWICLTLCAALLGGLGRSPSLRAGDWPQLLGPNRDGVAENESLLPTWPSTGPQKLWTISIGSGYAGVAVQDDRAVLFHRVGAKERIEAISAQGKSLWKQDFDAHYQGGFNPDNGPRCTPVIDRGLVFAFGAAGDLYCVSLADGAVKWSRSLANDNGAPGGYFGAGSSPIVLGDRVLVNLGARGAGLVALNRLTGKTLWKGTDEGASYSSPIPLQADGKTNVLFVTRYNAVCVQPDNGKQLFSFPFGMRGPTVNAATPLVANEMLFLTASYGIGAEMHALRNGKPKKIWGNDRTMSSQYATPVFADNHLYGCHGREDVGSAAFRCVEAATGKVKWSQDQFGVAHVIRVKDHLLIQTSEGRLELAKVNPEKYERLAQAQVCEGSTRAIPALSNGRLYVRQNDRSNSQLICLQVGATSAKKSESP